MAVILGPVLLSPPSLLVPFKKAAASAAAVCSQRFASAELVEPLQSAVRGGLAFHHSHTRELGARSDPGHSKVGTALRRFRGTHSQYTLILCNLDNCNFSLPTTKRGKNYNYFRFGLCSVENLQLEQMNLTEVPGKLLCC